jgi:class 3 adenylate cyclase
MASSRCLAAILAADVAGYSRLMGADEEGTLERLKAHRRQLIDPKITEHHGRIVKTTGDGLLVEFASVVDAMRCAAEVQRGMLDREPDLPEESRIRFRIGINLGDVIADCVDIFGDGVNVAARLEALAEPGGICVSGVVCDQVRDKLPYPLEDWGEQSVKNIARPVRAYALRPEVIADLPALSLPLASPGTRPFCNRCSRYRSADHRRHRMVALAGDKALSRTVRRRGYIDLATPRRAASVDRRIAFRQSQQRPRAAIFCRRDHRRSDDRSVADRA